MSEVLATPGVPPAWQEAVKEIDLPPGLTPRGLADLLAAMPEEVAGLPRRRIESGADSATAVYIVGEETAQPRYGMVVILVVPRRDDADAVVGELQRERWGDPADHTVTASSPGDATHPAFIEFWRTFPPGLFALPNQPVYFLLIYRADTEYAFMVIGSTPTVRGELAEALGAGLGS